MTTPVDLLVGVPEDDRSLARAALRLLDRSPAEIGVHSRRMIVLARQLAGERPVDQGLLVAACAVHDLGLLPATGPPHRPRRFPLRSAAVLEELAEQHAVDPARARPWSLAVAGHLRWRGSVGEPYEVTLLRRAAWLDATGIGRPEDRRLLTTLDLPARTAAGNLRLLARVARVCTADLVR